ncbi:unnamed protein product [Prunus armeniaca]
MAQTSPNRKFHDWSSLHQDIVDSIAKRIVSRADLIAFAAVCKAWRSAAIKEYFTSRSTLKSPVLMIQAKNKENDTPTPEFYNSSKSTWSKGTFHKLGLLAPKKTKQSFYSSLGWLVAVSADLKVDLLHPLSHAQIELPDINKVRNHHQQQSFSGVPYEFIASKFVLSSSPSWTCDYIVTVIYRILGGWGFWRPGEDEWTSVGRNIMDLAYYKGQFYAVDFDGNIMVCEIAEPEQPKMRIVVPKVPMEPMCASVDQSLYLVESQGALLVVLRLRQWFSSTTEFRVKNLGDSTLFLGRHNSSFSIECKKNKNFGMTWRIGMGDKVKFWTDKWLSDVPLIHYEGVIELLDLDCPVSSFFKQGWWDIKKLRATVPEEVVQKVISFSSGFNSNLEDSQIWKPNANGIFTDKIISNDQRVQRHLSMDSSCSLNAVHILRDCRKAKEHWLKNNIFSEACCSGSISWSSVFVFICWYLWKWRNQFSFNAEEVVPSNPRQIILSAVSEWSKASCGCRAVGEKVQSPLAWDFPGTAVVKLNVDGSHKAAFGNIGAGGVLRDGKGEWLGGFAVNLGKGQTSPCWSAV